MNFLGFVCNYEICIFQLRDERESAILSAEVKFRKQFEKEAAKVKKDLAEYKDKALKAQDKINNLENKIRDLLKENKGLR